VYKRQHVDGGTSRFDKSGRIYHAVCGGCGGQDFGFTSTPEVFSPTNNSSNCNLAAFKFELSTIDATVSNPATTICIPNPLVITNNSTYGNTYLWDFGDGITSHAVNPSHVYSNAGSYTVSLTVSDSNDCYTADSIEFEVQVGDFHAGVTPVGEVCPGEPFQLDAFGGTSYHWMPAAFLSNSSISSPIATISQTTTFSVIITDSCGIDTLNVTVNVGNGGSVSNDTTICIGESVTLHADGGSSYTWTPNGTLDNATSQHPIATPSTSTLYVVAIVSSQGCVMNDSILVTVIEDFPTPELPDSLIMCYGKGINVVASGGETYHWYPDSFIDTVGGCCVFVNPINSTEYYCDFTNACGTIKDSIRIHVHQALVTAENDLSLIHI
jgi:PKD repeat protein